MKIGIDARSILNPDRAGGVGIGHYVYHLLRNLKEIDKENEFVVLFDSTVREKDIEKFKGGNFSVRFFPYQKYGKYLPSIYKDLMLAGFINREKFDVLHIFGFNATIPPKINGKVVLTVRGIGWLKYPELYSKDAVKTAQLIKNTVINNGKDLHLIVSSDSLKKDAAELLKISEENISTIYEGVDKRLLDAVSAEDIEKAKKKYNLGNHGILCMGTIEPAKNLPRLLLAYKRLREKTGYYYKMVIAGKDGWMAQEIRNMANDLEISQDIVFTGYIPPEDLSALFRAASAFVFVPLYEGFGSPVVEAMACGKPIVASDIPVLREIIGGSAVYADPRDVEGMADAMIKATNDKRVEKDCRENCGERMDLFRWDKLARKTLDVYKKILS